ncbi:unnamed protein product [Caenorhabditis auriculariae]|uniref:Tetratricopeptide repeat protein 21A/21B N-terminal ARM repeat domain-containing protein n=1 Tax=Caenorhabditis auriculariae TaxID=2777116 RepID=A0A8S1HR13_9PELO|nr:unnamed protein product [Caenorhabditis auriculariae]
MRFDTWKAVEVTNAFLGALYALKWAHSSAFNPDHQSLVEIDSEISTISRNEKTSSASFASAAEVLYFNGELNKAKQLLDTALRTEKKTRNIIVSWVGSIWLWVETKNQHRNCSRRPRRWVFRTGWYIGRCRLLEGHHSGGEMAVVAKELTITSYQFVPGYIERCKAALLMREWAVAMESLENSEVNDSSNPYIELFRTTHAICFAGYNGSLTSSLKTLQRSLEENEAANHALWAKVAGILTRISAKDRNVLIFAKFVEFSAKK